MKNFQYYRPQTLTEACLQMSEKKDSVRVIAGGTDVIPEFQENQKTADNVIDISKLRELKYIYRDGCVHIGAMSTFSDVEEDAYLTEHVKVLHNAAWQMGSPQIRNLATLGGNVVNSSVAGDSLTAFLALDASVVLQSVHGRRVMKMADFLNPPQGRNNLLEADELLTEIFFAEPDAHTATAFYKLGKRDALTIVDVAGAMTVRWDDKGRCKDVHIRGGALARYPLEFTRAQEMLKNQPLTRETLYGCMDVLSEAVRVSIAHRPWEMYYKKESVRGVFETVFNDILAQYSAAAKAV